MKKVLFDLLESIVDKEGLPEVLDALEILSHTKADHIGANWQDDALASRWTLAGSIVGQAVYEIREKAFEE